MHHRTAAAVVVALICCSLAFSIAIRAQGDSDTAEKIKQLQQDQIKAQTNNDPAWAQDHLADGYIAGHSWGEWETKAETVKDFQSKTNKWKSANIGDLQVATYGSHTAVARYKLTYDADFKGTHRARSVICTDTWVNDSGTWKSAATHCSVAQGR